MDGLSVDYVGIISSFHPTFEPSLVGIALLTELADRYEIEHEPCALYQFDQSGASYLFDLASSTGLPQEDRTIASWALTPPVVDQRDITYQRRFPLYSSAGDPSVDRGHLIPHLSGGKFGPNIFRQDRALNRGWSEQGKRYRALEREAAATPGTLYFGHLIYTDDTAYPSEIEIGILRGATLHVERFDNHPTNR